MKKEPMSKKLEEYLAGISSNARRAENEQEEGRYIKNIYESKNKIAGYTDPEIGTAIKAGYLGLHVLEGEQRNQKEIDIQERKNQFVGSNMELEERISGGGILPSKKEELTKQLAGLKVVLEEERRSIFMIKSEIEMIKRKKYPGPKGPKETIKFN